MLCQLCTALIDEICIFVRTDGKRGGDKIRMGIFCCLHGLFQSQANAALTAFAPFWFVFMTFCQSQKPFWFPCSGNDRNRSFQWHFLQEPPQFGEPVRKFRYMTALITKYYEMEENVKMDKDNVRTVAFQVPTELFEQLKAYLKRNGIKQNAFFLDCIRQALAEDAGVGEE